MTVRRYLQLDVFADRPGAGNPLGVVFDASDMDGAAMQAYAAWANLSETIFFLPPTTAAADYRVRIFTPRQELPFAGHPSVGAAWAALETGLVRARDGRLVQECAAGLLPVRVDSRNAACLMVHVRAPRARRLETGTKHVSLLHAAVEGLTLGPLLPALWNNGPDWWLVQCADAAAVRSWVPDLPAIARLTLASESVGLAAYAITHAPDHQLVVRAFCPADGIAEDPVTGSVNAAIGACLHEAGRVPGNRGRYTASQGRELGRDGRVEVQVDEEGDIWIGGQVQAVIRGTTDW